MDFDDVTIRVIYDIIVISLIVSDFRRAIRNNLRYTVAVIANCVEVHEAKRHKTISTNVFYQGTIIRTRGHGRAVDALKLNLICIRDDMRSIECLRNTNAARTRRNALIKCYRVAVEFLIDNNIVCDYFAIDIKVRNYRCLWSKNTCRSRSRVHCNGSAEQSIRFCRIINVQYNIAACPSLDLARVCLRGIVHDDLRHRNATTAGSIDIDDQHMLGIVDVTFVNLQNFALNLRCREIHCGKSLVANLGY